MRDHAGIGGQLRGLEPIQLFAFGILFAIVAVFAGLSSYSIGAVMAAVGLCLVLVATRYPYFVTTVAVVALAFTPDYIAVPFPGTGVPLNGRLVASMLLLVCGLIVVPRVRELAALRATWVLTALALAWVAFTYAAVPGSPAHKLSSTFALVGPDVAALLGAMLLASAPRGRKWLLLGMCIAGAAVSVQVLVEFALQRNLVLELGVAFGSGADQWVDLPTRFGFVRAAGSFGHPIELGVFLSLTILAALEAARSRLIPSSLSLGLVALMFIGQITTLSRGPVMATVAVVIMWAVAARPMSPRWRFAIAAVVLVLALAAASQAGVEGGISGLVQTGDTGTDALGGTASHRVDLNQEYLKELAHPALTGIAAVGDTATGRTFVTIDHEGLFLLLTRGLLGMLTYFVLVLVPVVVDVRRLGKSILREPYAPLVAIDLVLCGATVAFFGLLQAFIWVSIGIMWSTIGHRTEMGGEDASALPPRATQG